MAGLVGAPVAAQDTATAQSCEGLYVRDIRVDTDRPQFKGVFAWWRKLARGVGLHHETTQPGLIRRFVTLTPGKRCTEFRRTESERILRAQPYLADASVTAERLGDSIKVLVNTVDEVPVVVGGRVSGTSLRSLNLGTLNFSGLGVHAEGRWEHHPGRRHGFGGKIGHPQLLGRPYAMVLEGMRRSLGEYYNVSAAHPFYTDLQKVAWYSGYSVLKDFANLRRPDDSELLQPVSRAMWNVGGVIRVGPPRHLLLLGGMLMGERVVPRHEFFLVDSTSGALIPTEDTIGTRRYPTYDATHLAGVVGLRALSFSRMRGLDALVAEQDVGTGTQIGTMLGLQQFTHDPFRDAFAAIDVYVGARSPRNFIGLRIEADSRLSFDHFDWKHLIGSGRAAWYFQPRDQWTSEVSIEGAGGWRTMVPFQLELGERRGGVRGFARSREPGSQRLLARVEQRAVLGRFQRDRAAYGAAVFTDIGRMWAGDVPFGQDTPVRASVGVALLGAVPARSQRTMRVELALPTSRAEGARPEVRFIVREPIRGFWFEPPRIRWARLSAVPEQIFSWP